MTNAPLPGGKHDDLARGGKWGDAQADLPRRNEGFSEQ